MNFRLKTTKTTEEILLNIKGDYKITPNILSRIAVSLSLKENSVSKQIIETEYKKFDNNGIDFQRHTLIGDYEIIYKVLMENFCNEQLTDEEFFPIHFKYHLEKGINLLKSEATIAANFETFIKNLISM